MAQVSLKVFSVIYTEVLDGVINTDLIGTFNSFSSAIDGLYDWLDEEDLEVPEGELSIPDEYVVLDADGYIIYIDDLEIMIVSSDLRFSW